MIQSISEVLSGSVAAIVFNLQTSNSEFLAKSFKATSNLQDTVALRRCAIEIQEPKRTLWLDTFLDFLSKFSGALKSKLD